MYLDQRDLHSVEVEKLRIDGSRGISSGVKSGHYVYFLQGGTLRVSSQGDSKSLRPGQIAWIGGGVERSIQTIGHAEWIILRIRNRLFASTNGADRIAWRTLMRIGRLSCVHPCLPVTAEVRKRLFAQAELLLNAAAGVGQVALPILKGHVLQCLGILSVDPHFTELSRDLPDTGPELDRLQGILERIEEGPASIASASILAKQCGLSRSALYRLFSSAGLPAPGVFLERARLDLAVRLLKESDQTILNIAMETGFGSLSAFYRAFERGYGQAPGKFRA
jgi:AraC-like DNA-binding protein